MRKPPAAASKPAIQLRNIRRDLAWETNGYDPAPGAHAGRGIVQCRHTADHAGGGARGPGGGRDGDARHRRQHAESGGGCGRNSGIGNRHTHAEGRNVRHWNKVHYVRRRTGCIDSVEGKYVEGGRRHAEGTHHDGTGCDL